MSSASHVVLLGQVSEDMTTLTFDMSYDFNCTFSGLYPWFEYTVKVVVFSTNSCCVSQVIWQDKVSFDPIGPLGSTVTFYPYPLQANWISKDVTGVLSDPIYLYPSGPIYYPEIMPDDPWFEYFPDDPYKLVAISKNDIRARSANQNDLTSWKPCYEDSNLGIKCVYQLGMGYIFELPSSGQHSVPVYAMNSSEISSLKIKPRTTCKYFPNAVHSQNISMILGCGKTNLTTNSVLVKFNTDKISLKACFMSGEGLGQINETCCDDFGLNCVHPSPGTLVLGINRSYLFYFLHDLNKTGGSLSTCKWTKSCDGYYQRITPRNDVIECVAPTRPPPSVSVNTLVLSTILPLLLLLLCGGFVLLWRFWVKVHCPSPVTTYIPSDEEALLGGELPRDAISKERYVDRGNFGYIFEGKLKVKVDDKEELTKQYEVALKILKTKVDEIENCSANQENIKDAKKAMKAEIYMMKQIQTGRSVNRNVLRMYGYVVDAPPYILVLELCIINLTRYLRQIRIQIDNKTLTSEEAKKGSTLSLEERRISHHRAAARNGSLVDNKNKVRTSHVEPYGGRESGDTELSTWQQSTSDADDECCSDGTCNQCTSQNNHESTESRLLTHSSQENKVTLAPPRQRMLSRGKPGGGVSSGSAYNDSVHGKMTRQGPTVERFQDTVLTTGDLLNFCWQVSSGMDFLHSFDLIHRDLAADNVLLKEETDGTLTLKICDFGQSRMLFNGSYVGSGDSVADRQRMFRLRWTAPEIKGDPKMWSKWSDVWSYGVFLWEVFSMGGQPYQGWPDHLVIDNLLEGLRMKRPSCCSESAWSVAEKCWAARPEMRGQFCDIKFKMDQLMNDERDKNMGIKRSDYVLCDVPPTPEYDIEDDLIKDWVAVSIQDIEDGGTPLDLELHPHLEDTDWHLENKNGVIIENHAFVDKKLESLNIDRTIIHPQMLKVCLDVTEEEIEIHTKT